MHLRIPVPHLDIPHLFPKEYEDHDGGPLAGHDEIPEHYTPVNMKWVVGPWLGNGAPGLALFVCSFSNKINFYHGVALSMQQVGAPVIAPE